MLFRSETKQQVEAMTTETHQVNGEEMAVTKEVKARSRRWCFTWNNYSDADWASIVTMSENPGEYGIIWLVAGREVGKKTGTPHIQGAVVFKGQKRLQEARKALGKVHLSIMKGKPADSLKYCSKEDTGFVQGGRMPQQGRDGLYDEIYAAIKTGCCKTEDEVINEFGADIVVRGRNAVRGWLDTRLSRCKRSAKSRVVVLYGDSGVGKSTAARRMALEAAGCEDQLFCLDQPQGGSLWWDGYCGQKVVFIDEFKGNFMSTTMWNKLADAGSMKVPIKGGMVEFSAELVIVASNENPIDWWQVSPTMKKAYLRRIDQCMAWGGDDWQNAIQLDVTQELQKYIGMCQTEKMSDKDPFFLQAQQRVQQESLGQQVEEGEGARGEAL